MHQCMSLPYSRSPEGKMLWKGRSLELSDRKSIVQYCRQCIGEAVAAEDTFQLSSDWSSLIELVRQLLRLFPSNSVIKRVQSVKPPRGGAPLHKPNRHNFVRDAKTQKAKRKAETAYARAMANWKAHQEFAGMHPLILQIVATANGLGIQLHKGGLNDSINQIRLARNIVIHRLSDLRAKRNGIVRAEWRGQSIQALRWEILPPGNWNTGTVLQWLGEKARGNRIFDEKRLHHLFELKPLAVYRGNGQFASNGYLAFVFGENGPTALESGFVGNATYVLSKDWQTLSRLTKQELVDFEVQGDPRVRKLIHHDMHEWAHDVCAALRLRMPIQSNEY